MAHNDEFITRKAAVAMGLDETQYEWEAGMRFLWQRGGAARFSPLADPADAYRLEDKLRIVVRYKSHVYGSGKVKLGILVSNDVAGAVHHAVADSTSSLEGRMYAVTQFAALHTLMVEDDGEAIHG